MSRGLVGADGATPACCWPGLQVVRPKSGMPYIVWPVMHTYLVKRGLKQVEPQQVRLAAPLALLGCGAGRLCCLCGGRELLPQGRCGRLVFVAGWGGLASRLQRHMRS